jgi:isopentenyl-diphosphate delta-isomerase
VTVGTVQLVDSSGTTVGTSTVDAAHSPPGQRHRAFSVILVRPDGRVLLQRRAATKTRFPLRWANACCGHPGPDESTVDAATRRLGEELGLRDVPLSEVGVYAYRAEDPVTGLVEDEYDHVLIGRVDADPPLAPDPAEVAELEWVDVQDLFRFLAGSREYAPWLAGVMSVANAAWGSP